MSLYPSIIPPRSTERMKNLKKICITVYKRVLSYTYNSRWFVNAINQSFLSMSHLLMVPHSIRMNLNYRVMAAVVAMQPGSHILTLISLSLYAMRPVRAVNTVLVLCIFHTKKQKQWIWQWRFILFWQKNWYNANKKYFYFSWWWNH